MTSRLEAIRELRNSVLAPLDESCGSGAKGRVRRVDTIRAMVKDRKKKKDVSRGNVPFKEWLRVAVETVEDVTGMEADILPEVPWRSLYKDGYTPDDAVQEALRMAEDEDEDSDAQSGGEVVTFREWISAVDKGLKLTGKATLSQLKEDGVFSGSKVHQLFMDNRSVAKAIRLFSDFQNNAGQRDESTRGPRDKSIWGKEEFEGGSSLGDKLSELAEEFGVNTKGEALSVFDDDFDDDMDTDDVYGEYEEKHEEELDQGGGDGNRPLGNVCPDEISRIASIVKSDAEEGESRLQKKQEEASVDGGDFGRWGPATKAASVAKTSIVKAINRVEGSSYRFHSDGTPASADGGSELIFVIENSRDEDATSYFLVFKLKGTKEVPSWDVSLRKGDGIKNAKTVSSKSGVSSDKLSSVVSSLKPTGKGPKEEK
jgi:hypothetical protein